MKVAIVHYWFVNMRGGERVVERFCKMFPDADLFTHVYDPTKVSDVIRGMNVKTTFIQKLPGATKNYQKYLPLMPLALEELDLSGYDLVISSESGPAKGVIPPPDAKHICYCHSPMRYLWDQYPLYKKSAGRLTRAMMPLLTHHLRNWDVTSSARVDKYVANSNFVAKRIEKYYRREAEVLFPPVSTSLFKPVEDVGDYYLWVGQMTSYKRPDIAVEAFNALGKPLKAKAKSNIRFEERLDLAGLADAYARAKALIFTAEEDFGIVPVEAMASGRPVIAYGRGDAAETVVADVTGLFFDHQTTEALIAAVEAFEQRPSFDPAACVANAQRFSVETFDKGFLEHVRRLG
jgi:glycosyltransferase involved in cell wall biosynthesis